MLLGRDVVEPAVQAAIVVPVDPLHRRVLDVVDRAQRARQERLAATDGFGLNNPIVVSASALSYASPTLPVDAAIPFRTRIFANAIDVYLLRPGIAVMNQSARHSAVGMIVRRGSTRYRVVHEL